MWTLNEGVVFCQTIKDICIKHGFYIGIGGSVLLKGSSDNDLDIILAPLSGHVQTPYDHENLLLELYNNKVITERYGVATRDRLPEDKIVVIAECNGRRIDFFFPTYLHKDRKDAICNVEDLTEY